MTRLSADEARELGHTVRAACERLATEERVREIAYGDSGGDSYDTELWRVLCRQVGVGAIALPEEAGGAGYGARALGVVAHELGRALAPVPFLASTVLATGLLVDTGVDEQLLAGLIDGERTATAVLTERAGSWNRNAVAAVASHNSNGWSLRGTAHHVLYGGAADDLVVVATIDTEPAIFLVDSAAHGVTIKPERVLDKTRPMATIEFTAAAATRLSGDGPVDDVIERSLDRAIAVLSAEQVGACERVLEIATDYARTREQFGRAIGSFQAIKHRCADMLVDLEWARSASLAALRSVDDDDGDSRWRVSMAKAVCSEALRAASHANLQIHGGIGFTWEDSAHLYVKRARTDEVIFGAPGAHWDRLAAEAKLL
ncbi:acyl-CoA dehydrogenase [Mycobacterium heckeshornense]|uniref:Acyl-CoA dehydrogenase n=1 Tax=Mycobacterium heckeshornense TaxID=110505 RepID=A0A2G8B4R8_9MYCO|nr:acyl-CoA dehydrogenase family protein [Mycobacterium heckeshornense]KMV24187.1 acyl-CoA dehydrogenase [Mycobacterium heckeshornense]MCV7036412.1 acyl-CoA dehydrogenase family protein [Mycobacterium heckeshornense]PIJ32755.1 acyl-CoA dehydrogenase [Mycobacterium heckeshornense]BCO34272.1 acyl-CoA dehydrogenase [Mycobacterium heckeshornense]BCQ07353.1 acyl-CoA dehydrogenase [Mycobacterium heckeshornense]